MRREWKRVLVSAFVLIFVLCSQPAIAEDMTVETALVTKEKWDAPSVTAHAAVLIDAKTGDILYDKYANKQLPPASTTKIMTAILGLELSSENEVATVSERADEMGESSIYLSKGEKIKVGELIEGALLRSGNDACVAIAENTAGSVEEFVSLMNKKAYAIGSKNTHFTNTNGLPDENHYSSAYDLAVMARYGLENKRFSEIVEMKYATLSYEYPLKSRAITNTNKLLWNYSYADGVKTGTTNAAGKCLVASAQKDNRRLICVVLNAPDRYGDSKKLLEWGFNNT